MLRSKVLVFLCYLFTSSGKEIGLVLCRITENPFDIHGRLFWMVTIQKILMRREKYSVDGCKYPFFQGFNLDSPLYILQITFRGFFLTISKQHEYLSNDAVVKYDSFFRLIECRVEKTFTHKVLLTACSQKGRK